MNVALTRNFTHAARSLGRRNVSVAAATTSRRAPIAASTTKTNTYVKTTPAKVLSAKASTSTSNGSGKAVDPADEALAELSSSVDVDPSVSASTPTLNSSSTSSTSSSTNANGNGNGNGNAAFGLGEGLSSGSTEGATDWSRSYHGLSQQPFPKEVVDVLLAPLDPLDVEIKPDGLIYLPEIKYRRVLNKAFGPGGWGLAPRGETNVGPKVVSREYALVCLGRLVAIARGEQQYFDRDGIATATEACKSNALMRCCKDLGVASELWDPRFIREFKAKYCVEVFAEHVPTKKKKKLWRRKDQPKFDYPFKE